ALQTLCELPAHGRRIAVLGDMRELGETSADLHRELGRQVATMAVDELVCVGELAALIGEAAQEAGLDQSKIVRMPDSSAAATALPPRLRAGDLVLLKGSRGIRLERIAETIARQFAVGAAHAQ